MIDFAEKFLNPTAGGAVALSIPVYLLLIQPYFRYLNLRHVLYAYPAPPVGPDGKVKKRKNPASREEFKALTMEESWKIVRQMADFEFPEGFMTTLSYGFVQTLAFPGPAKLLNNTVQISGPKLNNSPKRFIDTVLLMTHLTTSKPGSDAWNTAVTRINYLHARYSVKPETNGIKEGGEDEDLPKQHVSESKPVITNEQMLYVLAVFCLNPILFCNPDEHVAGSAEQLRNGREWRKMSDLERAAQGKFWMVLGVELGCDFWPIWKLGKDYPDYFAELDEKDVKDREDAGTGEGETAWVPEIKQDQPPYKDPINFVCDLRAYMLLHEKLHLAPDFEFTEKDGKVEMTGGNHDVGALAGQTMTTALKLVPSAVKPFLLDMVMVGFEDRFRKASGFPTPSPAAHRVAYTLDWCKRNFRRYIGLPRPRFLQNKIINDKPDAKTKLFNMPAYETYPFYVKPTLMNRYGPEAWLKWVLGGDMPGQYKELQSDGYVVEELGPERYKGKGKEWMEQQKKALAGMQEGGRCPFGF